MKAKKTTNALTKMITVLVKTLEQAKDFAVEQAPDLVKQMLAERKVELQWDAATAGVYALVSAFLASTAWDFYAVSSKELAFFTGLAGVVCVIATLVFAGILIENLKALSMLRAAPKVYLLEQLRRHLR